MGIRSLSAYCLRNENETSRFYELNDLTLAVDFIGFQFFVCKQVLQTESSRHSSLVQALGGCPRLLEQWLDKWLKRLKDAGINLLFVADPPHVFFARSHYSTQARLSRSYQAHNPSQQRVSCEYRPPYPRQRLQYSAQGSQLPARAMRSDDLRLPRSASILERQAPKKKNTPFSADVRWPLATETIHYILRRRSYSIETAFCEADLELADLVRSGKAFAILGDDSDFLCMSGVRYIPFDKLLVTDTSVHASVFSPELVAASLRIPVARLVDLALLCTNDFTAKLKQEYHEAHRTLPQPVYTGAEIFDPNRVLSPECAAVRIRYLQCSILDDPHLQRLMNFRPSLEATLHEAFHFYGFDHLFNWRSPSPRDAAAGVRNSWGSWFAVLDSSGLASWVIDVKRQHKRRLNSKVDVLSSFVPGAKMNEFLAPARRVLYHSLGLSRVEEITPQAEAPRIDVVFLEDTEYLRQFSRVKWELLTATNFFEVVVCHVVFDSKPSTAVWQDWDATDWEVDGVFFKDVINGLLVLWSCGVMFKFPAELPAPGQVVTTEVLDLLLLTSIICCFLKGGCVPCFSTCSPPPLPWNLSVCAYAFNEILRELSSARIVLNCMNGDKRVPFFLVSGDVLLSVFTLTKAFVHRHTSEESGHNHGISCVGVIAACFGSDLRRDPSRIPFWYHTLRGELFELVEHLPPPAAPSATGDQETKRSSKESLQTVV
ncbi:hypothetical protein PINS_up017532 [Pythium insidiosum]|nr:hypothetical protein PINS_up017532 [Pythium insidiosum]